MCGNILSCMCECTISMRKLTNGVGETKNYNHRLCFYNSKKNESPVKKIIFIICSMFVVVVILILVSDHFGE